MHPISHTTSERIRESYYALTPNLAKYETIEDVTVIWLDSHLNVSLDCFDTHIRLRRMIDHLLTFNSNDVFLEYFNSGAQQEQIFFIVSGTDGECIVPQIHSSSTISSIYIFCNDTLKHEQWAKAFTKISGVFNTKDALFKKLTADITLCLTNLLPIRILGKNDVNQKSLYDLTLEGARSMWFQLLIETLVKMKHADEAKTDLLEICRKQYKNNQAVLSKIDEFDRTYTPEKAVWWYTQDSFLYRLLNKALRTENIDIIYKFRWFLFDLDQQIRELHKEQLSSLKPKETLYRGQKIPAGELKNLQENINGYVAMNAFTSISKSSGVALDYAGDGEERPELESIIFQIEINTAVSPCADIKNFSNFSYEEEMLLTIGSVFRIVNVEPFGNRWIVDLTLDKADNQQMEELTNYLKKELFSKSPLLHLAKILLQMSEYDRAERYCIRANKELPSNDNDRVELYRLLGDIYRSGKGDYEKAKEMYDKAFSYSDNFSQSTTILNNIGLLQNEMGAYDAALKTLEEADVLCHKDDLSDRNVIVKLANIYVNQGIVYRHQLDFVKSLENYKKALDLNLQFRPKLHPSLSVLYNNIGYLNCVTCEYDASLTAYENALKIQLQTLPKVHTDLATVYNNMGIVYMAINKYSEALGNFEKALNMFKELLEVDHPTISTLHHNIGDTYRCLKQYDKAVSYLEKALELRSQKLSMTHVYMAESYESLGWTYYHLSNYEKALDCCEKSLEIQSDRAVVFHCIGMIHESQCKYDSALSALKKTIDLYEKFPAKRSIALARVHRAIAKILTIQQKPNDAIKYYNKAIEVYHSEKVSNSVVFIEIYDARGAFFCETGKYNEALSDLEMALGMAKSAQEDRLLSNIFMHIGNIHFKQHNFDEALKYFQDAEKKETTLSIEQYSTKGERLYLLADLSYQQKNYDAALENYLNAMEIFSQSSPPDIHVIAHIQVRLGRTYQQKCFYDKSLGAFQEALRLFTVIFKSTHPAIADLHYKIACIRKIQGIRHITFEAFKTALHHQLHSTSIDYLQLADIYDNLADIMAEQEKIEESSHYNQESLQIRLKHNPSDAFLSYINMGRLKTHQEQYLEAQELFQKAIDVFDPDNTFASSYNLGRIYVDLALVYNMLQKYDEAMKTISEANKAKQLDDPKTDSLIAYAIGHIYQMQNQYEEALHYYEKILFEFYPAVDDDTLALTYMRMADIYYKQKQFKLAIGYCEKCLNIKSKDVTLDVVYESIAGIYISFGQEDEGAKSEYYAKALDNLTKMLELCSWDNKKSGEIHGTIANLRRQLNDTALAIKHYELSRDHLLNMSPRNYNDLLAVYEALVDGYQGCQNKQKVIENYELALNICLNNDCPQATKDLKKAAILCHEIGVFYYESKNIEKSIEYTEQGLQLELDAIVPTSELEDQAMLSLACSYVNLSTLYEESDDTEKQIVNLKKSLDIYRKFTGISSSPEMLCIMAQIYRDLGDCYEKINDPVLALKYHQTAFNCLEQSGIADETKLIEYKQCLEKMEKLGMHTDK